jgi:beta-propeller repeat-containing protein
MRHMTARHLRCLGLAMSLALAAVAVAPVHLLGDPANSGTFATHARQQRLVESYGKLPLSFELNQGQTDRRVRFLSRGSGYGLFLTANEAVLTLQQGKRPSKPGAARADHRLALNHQLQPAVFKPASAGQHSPERRAAAVVRMRLVGANSQARISGLDELPGKSNYFIGNDPTKWRTNLPTYAKVKYSNVYPGVDLVYYGNQGQLEYDFILQPGADPRKIRLTIQTPAVKSSPHPELRLDRSGDLIVGMDGSQVRFHKSVVYQPDAENMSTTGEPSARAMHLVESRYRLDGDRVSFEVASYDSRRPLVVDPTLAYSTYLGGTDGDGGSRIVVDGAGNAYVVGTTDSTNFPTTPGAFQTSLGGHFVRNAFVSKLNPTGSALVYSTYLGGTGTDEGFDIALDGTGHAYVTGLASSTDFPITPGAFQTTKDGSDDVFISKLNPTGSTLVYSTYLGGRQNDAGFAITLDGGGHAYVTGFTHSANFPTTQGAFQTSSGGFYDAFVSKLNVSGSALLYSTYLGGNGFDDGSSIVLDSAGHAYVTGFTQSTDFPSTPGAFQTTLGGFRGNAFVSKLNASGSSLLYSTYLGGSDSDSGSAIALDGTGHTYITGAASSSNFPITADAFQGKLLGPADAFVTELNAAGRTLLYSTYLGGSRIDGGGGIALDGSGNTYVTGLTLSNNFPITPGTFQTNFGGDFDTFVSKFSFGPAIPFAEFGGHLRIDPDSGVFLLSGGFTLGSGGNINPHTQQVTFSVGNYAIALPAGSFAGNPSGYVYQKKVNNIFLCIYIKNTSTPGSYVLLVKSGHDALTGTTISPVPVTLTIGDNSGSTQMNAKFN